MKEKSLRTLHRTMALPLVLFIIIQSVSGIILTLENILNKYWGGAVQEIHYGLGTAGDVYRLLLGAGMVWMSVTGILIYLRIRARTKKTAQP